MSVNFTLAVAAPLAQVAAALGGHGEAHEAEAEDVAFFLDAYQVRPNTIVRYQLWREFDEVQLGHAVQQLLGRVNGDAVLLLAHEGRVLQRKDGRVSFEDNDDWSLVREGWNTRAAAAAK